MYTTIEEVIEIRRLGYKLTPVKVQFKSSVQNLKFGNFYAENILEGSIMSIPLWAAKVLEKNGFVEIQSEGFEEEFYKSVAKEKLLKDSLNLSQLSENFYLALLDFLDKKRSLPATDIMARSEYLKIYNDVQDLISIRIRKLLHYARPYSDVSDILPKLTLEEQTLLKMLQKNVKEFVSRILEVEK
ncbi:MAG: hypothetical protein QXL89_02655 [Nitrososphaeria archaeon]